MNKCSHFATLYANVRHIFSIQMHKLLFIINIASLLILLFISSLRFFFFSHILHSEKCSVPLFDAAMCIACAFGTRITIAKLTTTHTLNFSAFCSFFFLSLFAFLKCEIHFVEIFSFSEHIVLWLGDVWQHAQQDDKRLQIYS